MAGRRTNLALLVLLAGAVLTGGLAFGLGSGWNRWATVVHGVVGVAILLLAPWKQAIARRGLRRRRPGSSASLALSVLVAVALVAGLGHSTGLLRTIGPLTAMQVHVGAALGALPFAVWHVVARRIRPRRTDLSRRNVLRAGALAGGSLAGYGALAGLIRIAGLPGRSRRFTGSYEAGSGRPEAMPVTHWLDDPVPSVSAAEWRRVLASASGAREMSLDDLDASREPVRALLDCTGGWFAEQEWEGVRLDRLFDADELGRSLVARSVTGYSRRYPLRDLPHLWIATRVGGRPLSPGHGFPARIVAPGRRGFWWVKWVVALRGSDAPSWWQPPFPLT